MADLDARVRAQEDSARVASPFYPPAVSPRDSEWEKKPKQNKALMRC